MTPNRRFCLNEDRYVIDMLNAANTGKVCRHDGDSKDESLRVGHAAAVIADLPAGSIDLIITSPPYWTAVEYEGGKSAWKSYELYLADLQTVWTQCARVLRPNGKLCINAPVMPIPKELIKQHTRHLKNIAFDIEH